MLTEEPNPALKIDIMSAMSASPLSRIGWQSGR